MVRDTEHGLAGPSDAPAWLQRPGDRMAQAIAAAGLERWARLFAILLTVLLLLVDPASGPALPAAVGLTLFVVLTGLARRDRYVRAADLLAAVALVAAVGPGTPATLPFLIVAVAGPSAQGGVLAGIAAGGTLTVVMVGLAVLDGGIATLPDSGVLPFALLLPMVGVITVSAGQLVADRTVRDRLAMQQANRLLGSLHRLAQDLPGGLDVATVCRAIVAEVSAVPGVTAGVVLLCDGERCAVRSSIGLPPDRHLDLRSRDLDGLLGRRRPLRTEQDLPDAARSVLGDQPWWRAAPLGGSNEQPAAILLAGFHDHDAARAARGRLRNLADDGGLALDNTRLFEETQARAATAARRRIASDLHDGVAQSLAHLKLELSLLARGVDHDPDELRRLAEVAEGALREIRETIADTLFLSVKTVKNHLTAVYPKLGVETGAQAVAEAYRLGLVRRR